jgi:hypothetical protein
MRITSRLRHREILTAQLTFCQRFDSSFSRGAAAALHWLTSGGRAPLTGAAAAPIDFGGIVHELAAAEAIIYGPPSNGREYARGVEHALLWAEFATSAPPTPAKDRGRGAGTAPATWPDAADLDAGRAHR